MKKLIISVALLFLFAVSANAQSCPTGMVCVPQVEANKLFDAVNRLIAAEDALRKLQLSSGATEVALARALSVIGKHEEREAINGTIILKLKDLVAVSEQITELWKKYALDLEARLNKPRSTWDKIAGVLKRVGDILAGAALGSILR